MEIPYLSLYLEQDQTKDLLLLHLHFSKPNLNIGLCLLVRNAAWVYISKNCSGN